MTTGQVLVIRGTIVGCFLVAVFCIIASAGAAPLSGGELSGLPAAASGQDSPQPEAVVSAEQESQPDECDVSDLFPSKILQWCGWITAYASEADLSPDLIAAVMWQESGGDPLAYSHSGAVGLMQVMPRDGIAASFVCNGRPCFASRPTIEELQDPEYNIAYGTRMLGGLAARLGSVRDALKSYGPMDVGYYYADKVLAIYDNYGKD